MARTSLALPHRYPFRFVESAGDGIAEIRWTANAGILRLGSETPLSLVLEMMAQAAMVVLPRESEEATAEEPRGLLVGIEGAELCSPIQPGEALQARADLIGRFGPMVKAEVEIRRGTECVARAGLLLKVDTPSA